MATVDIRRLCDMTNVLLIGSIGVHLGISNVSVFKNLSDHRLQSSAIATIGHAQKFVRSWNPVTVIVKMESRDLDRRPAYGRCLSKGRIGQATVRSTIVVAQAARRSHR
jgi:hypothetical protein